MASNNPQDYIDPIIRTMIARVQLQQNYEQQKAQEELTKQRFEELKKQNEIENKQRELANQVGFLETIRQIRSGGGLPSIQKSAIEQLPVSGIESLQVFKDPGSEINIPSGINKLIESFGLSPDIISAFPGPEALLRQSAKELESQLSTKEIFDIRSEDRAQKYRIELENLKNEMDMKRARELEELRQKGDLEAIEARSQAEFKEAEMREKNANYRSLLLAQARLSSLETSEWSEEDLNSAYEHFAVLGDIELRSLPQKDRKVLIQAFPTIKFLEKEDKTILNSIPKIEELINMLDRMANVTKGVSGRISAITGLSFGPKTELGETAGGLKQQIKTTSAELAKMLGEASSRISDRDRKSIENIVNALQSQNDIKAGIETVKRIYQAYYSPIFKSMSEQQAVDILNARGISIYTGPDRTFKGPDGKLYRTRKNRITEKYDILGEVQ
jgi:hypothetical protein